ncbi:MAG: NUDIX hydrolase [Clostridia bacterium]|nr:NUDIX hydrolase [Clostridia bacterium]
MKEYEILNENLKMIWREGFNLTNERHTQVSGYVFNDKNQLLIVKNETNWTIPGGHPENTEKPIETLSRELMEEACVTLKDVVYLGGVEVVEIGETYYQLRYTAQVNEILPFNTEWETTERLFVSLTDLPKYIKWANGITFSKQIESARKVWKI